MPGSQPRKRLYWVFPDRSSARQRRDEERRFWEPYAAAACRAGFEAAALPPEAVEVVNRPRAPPSVSVFGQPVTPERNVFVTDLYLLPYQAADALAQLMTFQALELAGFYLPVPPRLSLLTNDKVATHVFFGDGPFAILPSVRLQTGRDLPDHALDDLLGDLGLPLVVKPCTWGMGLGVTVARTRGDLRGLTGLASGSETAVVVQPFLGEGVSDHRAIVIDGEPHTLMSRYPREGELVANIGAGGRGRYGPVPEVLREPLAFAARRLDVPFFCMDFLFDGEQYWLSEVELDGAVPPIDPDRASAIAYERFRAYDRAHDAWLAARAADGPVAAASGGR